jgi:Ca-activated chloride channel homolog
MRSSIRRYLPGLTLAALVAFAAACSSSNDSGSAPASESGNGGGSGGYGNAGGSGGNGTHADGGVSAGASGVGGGTSQGGASAGGAGGGSGASGASGMGGSGGMYADAGAADSWTPPEFDAQPPVIDAAVDATPEAEVDADICAQLDSSKPQVIYQSADDSNSMGSPVIARNRIHLNQKVPASILRTYEFLNYYNIAYDFAPKGHVRVVPQMRPGKISGEYFLQVGIQSEQAASPRRTMNITFVLDNTGSMAGSPLALEKAAVTAIAGAMKPGDLVSMVGFDTSQWVLLDNYTVSGANDPQVMNAINQLIAGGSTDLHAGLVKGYELAKKSYDKELMNRVILISDGGANVGVVDADMIAVESHNADGEGIYLVGVGVGDGVNDTLMNTVTDKGRGAYVYLDSAQEAQKIFGARFDEVMEVAVRDIRLELTVPWYFTLKSTSAEQSSTDPTKVDPQYLSPSDAIVLHNTFLPCSSSQWNPEDTIQAKATYKRPITQEPGEDSVSFTINDLLSADATQLKKGTAIVAYAEALKKVEGLQSAAAKQEIDDALAAVAAADPYQTDPELKEIKQLLTTYRTMF